jgi:hypothetical protein
VYSMNSHILMCCCLFYQRLKLSTRRVKISILGLFILPKSPRSAFPIPVCFLQLERNVHVESKLANKQQTTPSLHTSSHGIYHFPVALVQVLRILNLISNNVTASSHTRKRQRVGDELDIDRLGEEHQLVWPSCSSIPFISP